MAHSAGLDYSPSEWEEASRDARLDLIMRRFDQVAQHERPESYETAKSFAVATMQRRTPGWEAPSSSSYTFRHVRAKLRDWVAERGFASDDEGSMVLGRTGYTFMEVVTMEQLQAQCVSRTLDMDEDASWTQMVDQLVEQEMLDIDEMLAQRSPTKVEILPPALTPLPYSVTGRYAGRYGDSNPVKHPLGCRAPPIPDSAGPAWHS